MHKCAEELKNAIFRKYNLFLMDELSDEQAKCIINDLHKLGKEPTYNEVSSIIKKFYKGRLLRSANESIDQAKTNDLQEIILKMIQEQNNKN